EGTLGIITEAWMRLQDRPHWRASASVHFDDYDAAVNATRVIVQSGLAPANCRLLDTADFLYGLNPGTEHVVSIEEGKQLIIELQSIGEADERGYRTVMCVLNGQLRPLFIRDHAITSIAA